MRSIKTLLDESCQALAQHDTARLDVELLLANVLNKDRAWLYTWPEKQLTPAQEEQFMRLLERRIAGEPIAYILGRQAFWSMDLSVTPATLIPRPETELLVAQALERIPKNARWRIADLGTGSGAIALALARERPACHITATDTSVAALQVARQNALQHQLDNVEFRTGEWLKPFADDVPFHMIVSNPPYICHTDPHLERGDVRFEPGSALCAGADGLDDLRIIIHHARNHLEPGGWLLLEHGFDQAEAVIMLLEKAGYENIQEFHDLADHPRVTIGQISSIR